MYILDLVNKEKLVVRISELKDLDLISSKEFEFDWKQEKKYQVYRLQMEPTAELLGLISIKIVFEELRVEIRLLEIQKTNVGKKKRYHRIAGILIAYACKKAFDLGFYGFVSLIPKTKLREHYMTEYGFKSYGKHLVVQLQASEIIMNKYLTNE